MKRSLRFIALILSALFLIAGAMTVVCYADEPVDQQPVEQPDEQVISVFVGTRIPPSWKESTVSSLLSPRYGMSL